MRRSKVKQIKWTKSNWQIYLFLWTLFFGMIGISHSLPVEASVAPSFSVEADLPENQVETDKSYFVLKVVPDQVQNLKLKLMNLTQAPLTLEIRATDAVTSDNGQIDYTNLEPTLSKTLKVPFTSIATVVNPEVTLKPNEERSISVQLSIPKEPFSGVILGGIFVAPKDIEQSKKKSKNQITNRLSIVKGVRLFETEQEVTPNIQMTNVYAGQEGYRNTIFATLLNSEPMILRGLSVRASVYKNGADNDEQPLYSNKVSEMTMAPNSQFNYAVPLNNDEFVPGSYIMKLTASVGEQRWEFKQAFKISALEAEELNAHTIDAVIPKKKSSWKWIVGVLLVVIVGVAMASWWIYRQRLGKKKRK